MPTPQENSTIKPGQMPSARDIHLQYTSTYSVEITSHNRRMTGQPIDFSIGFMDDVRFRNVTFRQGKNYITPEMLDKLENYSESFQQLTKAGLLVVTQPNTDPNYTPKPQDPNKGKKFPPDE